MLVANPPQRRIVQSVPVALTASSTALCCLPSERLAGRRFFPMAQIHHLGRRSGKAYVTPTSAHLHGDVLLIALTFGNQSDWSRNVRAAQGCTVRVGGRTYRATSPALVTWADDRALIASAFNPALRGGFRLLGIRQFMRLHVVLTG